MAKSDPEAGRAQTSAAAQVTGGDQTTCGPPERSAEPPSFEQSLARLDEIVHLLEEGEVGLDDALARYEEGVGLLRQAFEALRRAERRIEILSGVDAEGNPVTQPLDDASTFPA
ncbi:MAG: exodeoxyribonuclease VII small subunit [Thermoguttaceae bacterium]|jgi:exodeoxyribonuclease VII small subunit